MSHNVLYMRGQVAELRGNIDEARRWYEEALSISPTHVKSMQRLVSLTAGGTPLRGGSPWKQQGARDPQTLLWSQGRFARQANTKHKASGSAPPEGGVTGALGAGGAWPQQPAWCSGQSVRQGSPATGPSHPVAQV